MLEKIESCLKEFISCLQVTRMYPAWHPQFKKSIDKAYLSLKDVLKDRQDLTIGIIGEELVFEKEIFFELSKMSALIIRYLKERGVERIIFLPGLESEELSRFVSFLLTPKEEVQRPPQEYLNLLGVKNIAVGKIKAPAAAASAEDKVAKSMTYLSTYENSLGEVTRSLEAVLNEETIDYLALRLTVTDVMENLLGRYQHFLTFAALKRYDVRTFFHLLNVSILSMYFSSKIGFAKEEILDIGTAALFHDIGKTYISRKLIQKSDKLTEEEFTQMKSHVIVGTEILLKYVDTLGILPVVVCFEHHLKYNLKGYPKVSFYQKPHIASMIVSLCDIYDALSQRRSYKSDYPPEMIYDLMLRQKGDVFEPQLLERFFRVIGVWPVGTLLLLSDGRVAVAREENEDDIFCPKVEVIAPADKKETIDLKALKGKIKIERSLNPLTSGKEYLPLI
ncbi:MAG: HD domain-containing protein [Candidatus Omnitrophota bacterium]|jgi:putative nucleotidyltransferase with HDIG domain